MMYTFSLYTVVPICQSQIDWVFLPILSHLLIQCLLARRVFCLHRKCFRLCLIILYSDNSMNGGDSKLVFPNISGDSKTHSIAELGSNGGTEISKVPINIVNATTPLRKSSIDLLDTTIDYPEYVRSIKEKECWLLFQKMANKGISVSYETILRGMLTPSEVRIAQKKQREITERQASLDLDSTVMGTGTGASAVATGAQGFGATIVKSDSDKN